jgi:multidrug resistance efflux pump
LRVGHTPEVAARHYADVPALRPLHEATVADAFCEAVNSARAPIVLTAEQESAWRTGPTQVSAIPRGCPIALLDGEQDVWLAGCATGALAQAAAAETRSKELHAKGWTTDAQLDQAKAAADEARARLNRAKRTVELTKPIRSTARRCCGR